MRVLVLGGTGFLGAALARAFTQYGYTTAVFHRGLACEVNNGLHVHGDRQQLEAWADEFASFAPDIVVDAIAGSAAAARRTLRVFGPVVRRIVFISGMNVYRAWGVYYGTEPGDVEAGTLDENAPLRRQPAAYPASMLASLRQQHAWMAEGFDRLAMERAAAAWPNSAAITIVRLGVLYGPGDRQRSLIGYWQPMQDGREAILLPRGWAEWRCSRVFVHNAAAGICLAATSPRAAGRVFNLAEDNPGTEAQWVQRIGKAFPWRGRVIVAPPELMPVSMRRAGRSEQSLCLNTSRIRRELGYRERYGADEAMHATLDWERMHAPARPREGADYSAEDRALRRLGFWTLAGQARSNATKRSAITISTQTLPSGPTLPPVIHGEP